MGWINSLPILISGLLCSNILSAQQANWCQNTPNEETGFPQDFVYSIVKDKKGLMWVGTGNGLVCYDGKETTTFTVADGLSSDIISSSLVSSSGLILVGHFQGSISSYNGSFFKEIVDDTLNSEVVSIVEDSFKAIWCATRSAGFMRWDQTQKKHQFIFPDQLMGKIINQIAILDKQLLVATNEGLYVFQWTSKGLIFKHSPKELRFRNVNTLAAVINAPHRYWIGTEYEGLYMLDVAKHKTPTVQLVPFPDMALVDIRSIAQHSPHSLWIGTFQKGALNVHFGKNYSTPKVTYFNDSTGFPILSVKTIYCDTKTTTWVGTLDGGLIKLSHSLFKHYTPSASTDPGMSEINDIAKGDTPGFYVATNKGLFRFLPNRYIDSKTTFMPLFEGEPLLSLYYYDRQLWIGKEKGGVYVFEEKKNTLKNITHTKRNVNNIGKVRLFRADSKGNIWLSIIGEGVLKINKSGQILERHSTRTGFIHNDIFAICPGSNGEVWFGSLGAGLAKIDTCGTIQRLSQRGEFPSHDVKDIIEDDRGHIWIATDGQGCFRFDGKRFEKIEIERSSDELLYVKKISYDGENKIWITNRKSIAYFDLETEKIRRFEKIEKKFNIRNISYSSAVFSGNRKNALFSDGKRLFYFNLGDVPPPIQLPTYLTGLQIFFHHYTPPAPSKEAMANGIYPPVLLDYKQNHITFNLAAWDPNYTGDVYYRYYLESTEQKWSPPTQQHLITYSSVNPGSYTLHVQASYNPYIWNNDKTIYTFVVNKPYWSTWWFYMLQIVGILFLFGFTYIIIRNGSSMYSINRIMVFACIFIFFEYIQVWLESVTTGVLGGAPVYQIIFNFFLALMLLPLERWFSFLLKGHK